MDEDDNGKFRIERVNNHVTKDEMLKLVRTLTINKSSGNDQVLNTFLKYSPPQIVDMIVRLLMQYLILVGGGLHGSG